MTDHRPASSGMLGSDLIDLDRPGTLPKRRPMAIPTVQCCGHTHTWPYCTSLLASRQLWLQQRPVKAAVLDHHAPGLHCLALPPAERLTYEGLFVSASLFHVGAWPDSSAAIMHLVHNATTGKEGKGEGSPITLTGMRKVQERLLRV